MPVYSYAQLEQLWLNAGGSKATAPLAAAVAEAESGGNSAATSPNPDGGTNVGLWQLDTPGGKGAGYTVAQLEDPVTNATVAVAGSSGGSDWSAWATFASGAYKAFMSGSTTPDPDVPVSGGTWWIVPYVGFPGGKATGGAVYVQAGSAAAASSAAKAQIPAGVSEGTPEGPYASKAAAQGAAVSSQPSSASDCLVSLPSANLVVTTVGGGCLLDKSQARALLGGVLLGVAGLLGVVAALVIAASAFEHSGAARAVGQVRRAVPLVP